jgi:hypothetical protein
MLEFKQAAHMKEKDLLTRDEINEALHHFDRNLNQFHGKVGQQCKASTTGTQTAEN